MAYGMTSRVGWTGRSTQTIEASSPELGWPILWISPRSFTPGTAFSTTVSTSPLTCCLFVAAHTVDRPENLNVCSSAGVSSGPYQCPSAFQAFLAGTNAGVLPVAPDNTIALPGLQGIKPAFSGPRYPAGLLYFVDGSGNSVYHGLTLSATERLGKYFRLNANYTFSKTLDDGTFTTFVSTPENLFGRNRERANSNQDVRHRFVANFSADGPQRTFLRNTELSSIITAESPRPFTIFFGAAGNGETHPVPDRC